MKTDKYDCKWIAPWKDAPWVFQSCLCLERKEKEGDFSCDHQSLKGWPSVKTDCPFFEKDKEKT